MVVCSGVVVIVVAGGGGGVIVVVAAKVRMQGWRLVLMTTRVALMASNLSLSFLFPACFSNWPLFARVCVLLMYKLTFSLFFLSYIKCAYRGRLALAGS